MDEPKQDDVERGEDKMGIQGKISGFLNNKTVQTGAGALLYIQNAANNAGVPTAQVLEQIVQTAFSEPHLPNIGHMTSDLTKGWGKAQLVQYAKLWGVGEVLKMLGQGKWGNLAQKFAKNAAKGVVVGSAVIHSTIWHSPTAENNYAGAFSETTRSNFARAPALGVYNY